MNLRYGLSVSDHVFMQRCLELADRGRGKTGINPLVGAVLVRDGSVLAEGWHEAFGADHAEAMLLKRSRVDAHDVLYVNLEPCCHHGKTPPCTDAIIHAGIRNVVYGMEDPNPNVAGKGISTLRSSGINVRGPVLRAQCEWLNRGFVSVIRSGRPWVTLKKAVTSEGKIAHDDGSSLKITSESQDVWSHAYLRARHDAILVGVGTVNADDPQLTVRIMNKNIDQSLPQPIRLILDPNLHISRTSRILLHGTVIVTAVRAPEEILKTGVRVFTVPLDGDHFAWDELWDVLITPTSDFYGITSVLVEGGSSTWESFKKSGMVDAEVVLVGA